MKVKAEVIVATLMAVYAVIAFPPGHLLLSAILSMMAYLFTESAYSVIGVLVIMILLRILKIGLVPTVESRGYGAVGGPTGPVVGTEGFQPKDPISIHQRLASSKRIQTGGEVQGVLEAPEILNSLQVSKIDSTEQGQSSRTLPAVVGLSQPIRTPAEGFVPNVPSPDKGAPRTNRFVEEEGDTEAVMTALGKNLLGGSGLIQQEGGADVGPDAPM
jgi:hypothetical protein